MPRPRYQTRHVVCQARLVAGQSLDGSMFAALYALTLVSVTFWWCMAIQGHVAYAWAVANMVHGAVVVGLGYTYMTRRWERDYAAF